MSTLKATNFQHPSAGAAALVLDASGNSAFAGVPTAATAAAGTNTTQLATTAFANAAGGLVAVAPTSIANTGGSASTSGNTTTFTGVTVISLNGIFSSNYRNYRIIWQGVSVAGTALNGRLRAAGSDNTASEYDGGGMYGGTGAGNFLGSAQTSWQYNVSGTVYNHIITDFLSPNIATPTLTSMTTLQTTNLGTQYFASAGQNHRASTAFDGFTIILTQATTGTITVYGYKD